MLFHYLLSGGLVGRHPLHVDAILGLQIAISIPFSLVPYLFALAFLDTVRVLIRLIATLVLSTIVLFSTESLTRSLGVAGVCALIVLVSGLIWSVIPRKPTVSMSSSDANEFQENQIP